MPKPKKTAKIPKIPLDVAFPKRPRGRPGVAHSEIIGRAENYRWMFWERRLDKRKGEFVRDKPYDWAVALVTAKYNQEIDRALDSATDYAKSQLKPLVPLVLKVLNERSFPKRAEAKFDYLADSLAARGEVSPRRSRDICAEHRTMQRKKSRHRILRKEFYIECSCGYKGPALDNACRRCGAEIDFLPEFLQAAHFGMP
jgi:hypothetical protein